MAGRTYNDTAQAFELFLDTICNMFGSVLFIAMLVCVLLQLTPINQAKPPTTAPADTPQATVIDQVESDTLRVQSALELQQKQLDALAGQAHAEDARAYLALVARQQRDRTALDPLNRRMARLNDDLLRAQDQLESQQKQEASLERQLAQAHSQLREVGGAGGAGGDVNVKLRLPHFRPTSKHEIPMIVSGGQLFLPLTFNEDATPKARNVAEVDFVKVEVPGPPVALGVPAVPGAGVPGPGGVTKTADGIEPKAGAGSPIEAQGVKALLEQKLGRLRTSDFYVDLAVYPDSYAEAAMLRDGIIARRVEYNLVLMEQGQAIPTATGDAGVQ